MRTHQPDQAVISGVFYIGQGEQFDGGKLEANLLAPGKPSARGGYCPWGTRGQ